MSNCPVVLVVVLSGFENHVNIRIQNTQNTKTFKSVDPLSFFVFSNLFAVVCIIFACWNIHLFCLKLIFPSTIAPIPQFCIGKSMIVEKVTSMITQYLKGWKTLLHLQCQLKSKIDVIEICHYIHVITWYLSIALFIVRIPN